MRDYVSTVVQVPPPLCAAEKGHLLYNCLKLQKSTRTYVRQVIDGLSEKDHKDLLAELGFP